MTKCKYCNTQEYKPCPSLDSYCEKARTEVCKDMPSEAHVICTNCICMDHSITWMADVPKEDKLKLSEIVRGLEFGDHSNYPIGIGGFAAVYKHKGYALKVPFNGQISEDYLYSEELDNDWELFEDHYVMRQLSCDISAIPKLYGYSEQTTIMQLMQGMDIYTFLTQDPRAELRMVDDFKGEILENLEAIVSMGWYPHDIRLRSIHPFEKGGLKFIDFNLYQRIEYMKKHRPDMDFHPKQIAERIWEEIERDEISCFRRFETV